MPRKAIVLTMCCGAFFTASLACGAQTFGDLRAGKQTRKPTQAAEDPVGKWFRTLPAGETERTSAYAGLSADLSNSALIFDGNPISGEFYNFSRRTIFRRWRNFIAADGQNLFRDSLGGVPDFLRLWRRKRRSNDSTTL